MTPGRWERIEELYHAALNQPAQERPDFLEQACAGDSELCREVESLLSEENNGERLLGVPAWYQAASLLDESAPRISTRLGEGEQLGPYRISCLIGAGGMGEVYRAKDTRLEREVAIKLLPRDQLSDSERRRRFLLEAKAASALNHPNIVTFFDLASADDRDFLVMEYVAGQTLDRCIPREGLALREALLFAIQIADALAAAHGKGIVHRDLKPVNIMITEKGTVKLLDFGLAKLSKPKLAPAETSEARTAPHTCPGLILGTLSYMSPEQAEGKEADLRSDIFSFGTVLYEMLTGQRAFCGDSPAETLSAILRDQPKPPSSIRNNGLPDAEKILFRCLGKHPERRFQHADELKIALLELYDEVNVTRAPSVVSRKTNQLLIWAALALVTASALAGTYWLLDHRASSDEAPLTAMPLTSYPGSELDPALSPDGNQVAFEWEGPSRANSDIYVKLIGPGEPLRLTTDPARDHSPAWSPDGRSIAFLRELPNSRAAVLLVPALGGAERKLAEISTSVQEWSWTGSRALTWTHDGKSLIVPDAEGSASPLGLFLLSIDTGQKHRLTSPPRTAFADRSPAFSPDGSMLAFSRNTANQASDIYVLRLSADLRPQGEPRPITTDTRWNDSPMWIAGGREILFSSNRDGTQSLWRMLASGSESPRRLVFAGQDVTLPTFSERAHRLVYTQTNHDANIWRVGLPSVERGATAPAMVISSSRWDSNPDYSPDGRHITFQSDRSGSLEIWVCHSDGSHARQLTFYGYGETGTPRWSPDGTWIAFDSNVDGQFEIYVVRAEGGAPKRLTDPPGFNAIPGWSHDGAALYFTSQRTGRYEIWKVSPGGGQAVQVTKNGGFGASESPDGRTLYYLNLTAIPGSDRPIPLWQMPVAGGAQKMVISAVRLRNFAVTQEGIYYVRLDSPTVWSIRLFQPSTGKETKLAESTKTSTLGLSVSPDRRALLYSQIDQEGSDLMLIESFR